MNFLAPALLGFLVLIPILIILYLIRAQRRRQMVSSILLWRDMVQDLEVRTRLRKPPLSILMLLQIAALAFGGFAIARPFWQNEPAPKTQVIVILDASASMQSTDVGQRRFNEAQRQAADVLGRVGEDVAGAVIKAGTQATLLGYSRDSSALLAALRSATPTDGAGDIATAWRLAGSIAAARPEAQSEVYLFSDGSFPATALAPIAASSRFVSIGSSSDNQAITQVGVRRPLGGSAKPVALVRVANYSSGAVERRIRASADGIQFREQPVSFNGKGVVDLLFDPPVGTRIFSAQLIGRDVLAADDHVDAIIPQPAENDALLVSPSPDTMARALRAIPQLSLRVMQPQDYKDSGSAAIVIFDNFLPPILPPVPILVSNPPIGSGLASARFSQSGFAISYDPESEVLTGVDLGPVEFGRVAKLDVPAWAAPIVVGPDGPLILEGERDGRRAVVFGFDPGASSLPKLVAFPTLVANSVEWLLANEGGASSVGATVRLPGGLTGDIVAPGGATSPAAGQAFFGQTDKVGKYDVKKPGADAATVFAVNLVDERESDVAPRSITLPQRVAPFSFPTIAPEGHLEGRDLWPFLVAGVLALLSVEWWLFSKRGMS